MTTYSAIKAEIAKLEKQAEALRKTEVASVIAEMKEAIAAYALTAADLGFGRGATKATGTPKARSSKKTSATVGVAKYRDPKTGKTWTGRGKPPAWIAGVKNREPYLIEGRATGVISDAPARKSANSSRKAGAAETAKGQPKRARAKAGIRRKTGTAPLKTPAVEFESGAASE